MKKNDHKLRKVLLTICCALSLMAISVGATLAYLTDAEAVTNVFTVGQVGISLDEAKTDVNGEKELDAENNEIRISGDRSDSEKYTNKYHLIPGESYAKDPTVHVDANSEDSWIFVKVENGIADIEASGAASIAAQIAANGWKPLNDVSNVYYKEYKKGVTDPDMVVFESFTLKGEGLVNGNAPQGYTGEDEFIGDYADATVKVTAYAIQMAGFEGNAVDAWNAGKFE